MKKVLKHTFFLLTMAITVAGCGSNKEEELLPDPLSDEEISNNLAKDGKYDLELLIGEWDIVKFAYTADGNKISNVKTISSFNFVIFQPSSHLCDNPDHEFTVSYLAYGSAYSKSGYLIKQLCTYGFGYPPLSSFTYDEQFAVFALNDVYSFVIKSNELWIYFTEAEQYNLLIFIKKNEP